MPTAAAATLSFFASTTAGRYALEVDPRPGSGATADELPYASADFGETEISRRRSSGHLRQR